MQSKTCGAEQARAHLPELLDAAHRGSSTVITKRGRPVAKLVPADRDSGDIYHFLRGKGSVVGDVISPAVEDWGNLK